MIKFLIPRISFADMPPMFLSALVGAVIAGAYGIAHDHITYLIGPEYFTNFKFKQFNYADPGYGDRVFVTCIGFLATWWVGLFVGWFLARRQIPNQPRKSAYQKIAGGFAIVLVCGAIAGLAAFAYGNWRGADADYSSWEPLLQRFNVRNASSFVQVAYIHNASYLGALVGFILALVLVKPLPKASLALRKRTFQRVNR